MNSNKLKCRLRHQQFIHWPTQITDILRISPYSLSLGTHTSNGAVLAWQAVASWSWSV